MGNLKNFNFNKIDAYLTSSEYYDYTLSNEETYYGSSLDSIISGSCLLVYYDFDNPEIYTSGVTSGDTITSLTYWEDYVNSGLSLDYFGLTGLDNGYIPYSGLSGDTSNEALLDALTGSTVNISQDDISLIMNTVSGYTGLITYDKEVVQDNVVGDYLKLCGGFYQGYYKLDGYDYQVLPSRYSKGFVSEFWLRKSSDGCSGSTGTTLNDLNPNNEGFFFYMGTRAENKFWNTFNGNNTGCTSGCTSPSGCTDTLTDLCTVVKETDVYLTGDTYPISLSPRYFEATEVTNNFLIYGRASKLDNCSRCGEPSGLGNETVCSYTGDSVTFTSSTRPLEYETNPFLIYGRASKLDNCSRCGEPSGLGNETVCSYTGLTGTTDEEKDYSLDVIDNAIGFRIRSDGAIGYRLLTLSGSCDENDVYSSGVTVEEDYSLSGVVSDDEWTHVMIRIVFPEELDECELKNSKPRTGRLLFYVNGLLKHIVNDFDELILRRLDEYKDKQLGVPFNFSLGGGSQGLLESMTFDGQDLDDLGLHIESNFAGTFIGDISQFRFYGCDLNWCEIKNNFNNDKNRYI
jgi:hypothetical protein